MARVLLSAVALLSIGCTDFDPADRRIADAGQYELQDQACGAEADRARASGVLANRSGSSQGFGVIVRFFDGDVDLGRPQTVEHDELLDDGATWGWEVDLPIDERPADLRCSVIQVVIGDDVTHDGP